MTEARALADIVTWSSDCPGWQQDALRRLSTGRPIQPDEIDELVSICKGEAAAVPLAAEHFRDPARGEGEVHLRQVHGVQHVNALAPDQRLTLGGAGLTIIYGDNGSGKSGYARILKKACRARSPIRADDISPDIYDAAPGHPSATIEYAIGDQNYACVWRLGEPADAALTAVSVFDSRTANVHVDDTNDVAYTPFPLKALAGLAQLCKSVKDKLADEIDAIKARTPQAISAPACSAASPVGRLLAGLSATTEAAIVEALATLTPAEQDRLAQLTIDLAGDPVTAARQLTALKRKCDGHVARLDRLFAAIETGNAENLHRLSTARDTARRAAEAASVELFNGEPLPHIGSEVWLALWESARAYSEREAYPDRAFPVTGDGAVCVLCQQDLAPEAAGRLGRFDAFVRDDSQQRAEAARQAHDDASAVFAGEAIPLIELRQIVATVRDELRQGELATEVRRSALAALRRHRWIGRHHADAAVALDAAPLAFPRQALVDLANDVEARSAALMAQADSPERTAMIAEKTALVDRQWLSGVQADVLAQIERLGRIASLTTAQRQTTTNRITGKSTEVAQALVTDALRAQFAVEVASFQIAGLAVELRQQTSAQGIPRFKVALTRKPTASVGQVLSEGEHRCVALAAFMAELATAGNRSGIVFDDPVSSLDHMHREAVAKRLVDEAGRRQVIVFTHDLAFLFELSHAANEMQQRPHTEFRSINRGADKAGFCRNETPFKARRATEITGSLANLLANERRHFEQGDQDEWRRTVKSIAGALRDTWEVAVEDAVSHVFRRLSHKVNTPGLVKLTAITAADCDIMREGYGRCSEMLHSAARELNRPLPRPEVLTTEIDALSAWANGLRQRQDAIR